MCTGVPRCAQVCTGVHRCAETCFCPYLRSPWAVGAHIRTTRTTFRFAKCGALFGGIRAPFRSARQGTFWAVSPVSLLLGGSYSNHADLIFFRKKWRPFRRDPAIFGRRDPPKIPRGRPLRPKGARRAKGAPKSHPSGRRGRPPPARGGELFG